MRLLVSWLRDFVDVQAPAAEIGERLGLRGFELAAIEPFGDDDAVIDFEITANRPDCLSVIGLAREVSALYDVPLKTVGLPLLPLPAAHGPARSMLDVAVEDTDLCPRYAAMVAAVHVGQAPSWMTDRLRAAGVRSINSIVDITNYVLIELGHPTHAFDLDQLAGARIRVRRAVPGERLTTLDGVERTLDADMLVIADSERSQAVAGVMGGSPAEVSAATRTVAFESAYFKPSSIRRTSKRLGLKTEASARFERGADINAAGVALARIAELMEAIGAGRVSGPGIDVYPVQRDGVQIHLRRARLAALLGGRVPDVEVGRILRRLGLAVALTPDGWEATAPTFRVDLLREVDLIEEVGRHYGYDKLPSTVPALTAAPPPPDPRIARDQLVRRVLTGAGLSEAVTFGIVEAKAAGWFVDEGASPAVPIANPLSAKFDTLRPSLLPGLVDAVAHNRRHGRDDVGLFEIGARFSIEGETRAVAIAWTGAAAPPHWSTERRDVDFFDIKGIVEVVCAALAVPVRFTAARDASMVPGRAAAVLAGGGQPVGLVGQIAPVVVDARGLPRQDRLFAAELNLDALAQVRVAVREGTRSLPRHPFVVRDVSIVVSDALPAEIIHDTIHSAGRTAPVPLTGVTFFDRYQGKGIADGSISLSVRMTFQAPDRTLTDADVQASVDAILAALTREHGAVQR